MEQPTRSCLTHDVTHDPVPSVIEQVGVYHVIKQWTKNQF